MWIFSSRRSKTKFKPTKLDLPIGALTYKTNPSTDERSDTVNPDLPKILARFAYYLDKEAHGTIYKRVYNQWLFDYLVKDATNPTVAATVEIDGNNTYEMLSDRQNTTDLFVKIRDSFSSMGVNEYLVYIGLYLFAAWFFLVDSVDSGLFPGILSDRVFSNRVRRYLATQCLDWTWTGKSKAVKVNRNFVLEAGTANYTLQFVRQAKVDAYELDVMTGATNLGDIKTIFGVPAELVKEFRAADNDFITFFRGLLVKILREEFLSLLREIDPQLPGKLQDFGFYAVGNGTSTVGLFGAPPLGISFFDYEIDNPISTHRYRPLQKREVTLWRGGGTAPPTIFLAQFGSNADTPLQAVWVTIGKNKSLEGIKAVKADQFLKSLTTTDYFYNSSTGLLTFKKATDKIVLTYDTGGDEVAFFTFSFFASTSSTVPPPSPDPRLRIDHLFLDNEFAIPVSSVLAFWISQSEQAALDSLVLKMRDDPTFQIISSISGKGIGVRVDLNGPDEFASDLVSAPDQSDNQTPNSVATGNQGLRYAYGEAIWTTVSGEPSVLSICTEGYASPLRCTWDNWPAFQLNTQPEFGGGRKIDELQNDIGQFLQPSFGRGASYNTALSAF
ncbi:MAG TPA: hypothetical protein VNG71_08190, partial [Pyrinomonadaceae bacterium]|nr:hypothetical protein [Pyrinomonadaceae bacterium]